MPLFRMINHQKFRLYSKLLLFLLIFSSIDENLVKNADIFVYTRKKSAIFAEKFEYERKYRISKEV